MLILQRKVGSGAAADPVDFLLSSNTTNGSTTFTDTGPNGITITPVGANVAHSTAQAKFGSSSIHFTGHALTMVDNVFAVGAGDFTYDLWIYRANGTGTAGLFANAVLDGAHGVFSYTTDPASTTAAIGNNGSSSTIYASTIPLTTWTHYAVVRSSGMANVAVNGVFANPWKSVTNNIASNQLAIGARYSNGSYPLDDEYIDEFRFSTTAVWTSDFTPPTAPYST